MALTREKKGKWIPEYREKGLREAIKEKLGKVDVIIDTGIENCEFCGKEQEKASKQNKYKGLTWLWPDEKWICNSCIKGYTRLIPASKA